MTMTDYFIESLLTSGCILFSIYNLLIYPFRKSYKLCIFILITLTVFLLHAHQSMYVNSVIYLIILFSIALYSKHPILDLCFAFIAYLLLVCIKYIFILFLNVFHISYAILKGNYYYIICIVFTILFYYITKCLGNRIRPQVIRWLLSRPKNPFLSKQIQILCLLELLVCFCIYQFNIAYGQTAGHSSNIIICNALLFITFFGITLIIFYFLICALKKELTAASKEYEVLQDYTNKVEQLYLEIRTFKHDYLNILLPMELLIKQKNYGELEKYFEQNILSQGHKLAQKDNVLGKLTRLQIPEIKSLFYPKLLIAMNQQLDTVVDIKDSIYEIAVDYLDLIRILGIFMDNAIEAAVESMEKTLYVGILAYDNTITIRICNSCNEVENFNRIADINVTSKSGFRGIGLYNANLLIQKYSNIIHKTSCENHLFTQELQIIGGD